MNATCMDDPTRHCSPDYILSAVFVYEDETTRDRIRRVYQQLVRELTGEAEELQCTWASFAGLKSPIVSAELRGIAGRADLVVFSAHAGEGFPDHVKAWIDTWLEKKDKKESALAALIDFREGKVSEISPIQDYLRGVAARGEMEFLSQAGKEPATPRISPATAAGTSEVQDRMPYAPFSHWGINE